MPPPSSANHLHPADAEALPQCLQCGRFQLTLNRPQWMGIINLTDQSFSRDGHGGEVASALAHAEQLIADGADILDLGAESTRPGSKPVTAKAEIARLLPVVKALVDCGLPLSVDTSKPEVMRVMLDNGVDMINDVCALTKPGAMAVVAPSAAAVCLMHMQGLPATMQAAPSYVDVVAEVSAFLLSRLDDCRQAGINQNRLVVDPGIGFGKLLAHNLQLSAKLSSILPSWPKLVGYSRKSMLGQLSGRPVDERDALTAVTSIWAANKGAALIRVHDVRGSRDALALWQALSHGQAGD